MNTFTVDYERIHRTRLNVISLFKNMNRRRKLSLAVFDGVLEREIMHISTIVDFVRQYCYFSLKTTA